MKTVIEMAREAGAVFPADGSYHKFEFEGSLERFAALVIANHPPQSYMTWQEGYEAGKQAEREACAVRADEYMLLVEGVTMNVGDAIRKRSNT